MIPLIEKYVGPYGVLVQQPTVCPIGPMRAFSLAVIPLIGKYVGPHDSIVQQPAVFPMGQCEYLACRPTRQYRATAHCVPDGPMRAFSLEVIPLIGKYVGPRDSLVQQPAVCPMGQCEHLSRQ